MDLMLIHNIDLYVNAFRGEEGAEEELQHLQELQLPEVAIRVGLLMVIVMISTTVTMEEIAAGLSSLGVPGVPWHTQILADQLTLFQPGVSDLPTALHPISCSCRKPHPFSRLLFSGKPPQSTE